MSQDTVPPNCTEPPNYAVPPSLRASDGDREQVIERLQHESVQGRLSNETFLQRVDAALRARRIGDLTGLLNDLPASPRRAGRLDRWVSLCSSLGTRAGEAWRTPRLPRLTLPRADRVFVIGRAPDCDLAIADITVSWRHAELRRVAGEWLLTDLGSTNGTRVNGWRTGEGFVVRPGDRVAFGAAGFLVAD